MSRKRPPSDVLEQIQSALEAWKIIDPKLKIGDLTQDELKNHFTQSRQLNIELDALEAKLRSLRNQRNELLWDSWQLLKRLRAGIKAIYGDDSSQYELIGGTRLSERKPYKKKETT